jgi:hypothetical protein
VLDKLLPALMLRMTDADSVKKVTARTCYAWGA